MEIRQCIKTSRKLHQYSRMDRKSLNRIKRNLVFFKENLTQIGRVMDKLIETELISMEEKAEILTDKCFDNQCHTLLELLMKRGGFAELIEALKISGNVHIAQKLLETDGGTQSVPAKISEKTLQVTVEKDIARKAEMKSLGREDTCFSVDDRKDEILQLISDRELQRMKYEQLVNKYKKLKGENAIKSDDIDFLKDEIKELQKRVQIQEQEKRAKDQVTASTSAQAPKMADRKTSADTAKTDGLVGSDHESIELLSEIDEQKITIEELQQENKHLENLVSTLEDQIGELKESLADKDDRIMKLRNETGKLKLYIEAGKREREKLTQELHNEMAASRQRNDERFDGLENKLEQMLNLVNINRNATKKFKRPSRVAEGNVTKK